MFIIFYSYNKMCKTTTHYLVYETFVQFRVNTFVAAHFFSKKDKITVPPNTRSPELASPGGVDKRMNYDT